VAALVRALVRDLDPAAASRVGAVYRLFQAGRWLAAKRPGAAGPADWTRETAAAFVAAVDRATVGRWSTPNGPLKGRAGQPFSARSKEGMLRAARTFLGSGAPRSTPPACRAGHLAHAGMDGGEAVRWCLGPPEGLKASFGGCSRAGLRLPPVDGVQVYSRLIRQADASGHRRDSAAGLWEW
jgi:hypothetical protein